MTFGEKVKKLRESKGMTQTELAEKAKVGQQFISKLEKNDATRLGVDIFMRLCDSLETPCTELRKWLPSDLPAAARKPKKK